MGDHTPCYAAYNYNLQVRNVTVLTRGGRKGVGLSLDSRRLLALVRRCISCLIQRKPVQWSERTLQNRFPPRGWPVLFVHIGSVLC